ncbi:MAG: nitrous oxide reductase accessory protein NosL [Jhaorihella sp.]
MKPVALIAACLLALAACKEDEAALPQPVAMSGDALGYYCQMNLAEHDGPKAQVHLAGTPVPLFFSQVRDAIAYQRMPEQDATIAAIYVSDMGRAHSWENPGVDNWIAATDAFYVVGSDAVGGMGASELVPFARRQAADSFARRHGGRIASLDEIADTEVLAPANGPTQTPDEDDYLSRLRALSSEGNG